MDKLSRDINILENRVARYIYIKYIQEPAPELLPYPELADTNIILNTSRKSELNEFSSNASSSTDDNDSDNELENDNASKVKNVKGKNKVLRPKVLDKLAYTLYRKNIFHQSRSCFTLNQNDLIREDIRLMTLADKAYEKHPEIFKTNDYELPPDVLRCSFIRKHHHRYYRCRKTIMNKDSDVCKTHEKSENIYYDNYNDLLESLGL